MLVCYSGVSQLQSSGIISQNAHSWSINTDVKSLACLMKHSLCGDKVLDYPFFFLCLSLLLMFCLLMHYNNSPGKLKNLELYAANLFLMEASLLTCRWMLKPHATIFLFSFDLKWPTTTQCCTLFYTILQYSCYS